MTDPRSRFYPILLSRESWDWAAVRAVVLFAFSTLDPSCDQVSEQSKGTGCSPLIIT